MNKLAILCLLLLAACKDLPLEPTYFQVGDRVDVLQRGGWDRDAELVQVRPTAIVRYKSGHLETITFPANRIRFAKP